MRFNNVIVWLPFYFTTPNTVLGCFILFISMAPKHIFWTSIFSLGHTRPTGWRVVVKHIAVNFPLVLDLAKYKYLLNIDWCSFHPIQDGNCSACVALKDSNGCVREDLAKNMVYFESHFAANILIGCFYFVDSSRLRMALAKIHTIPVVNAYNPFRIALIGRTEKCIGNHFAFVFSICMRSVNANRKYQ
ncbi:MAG: hypothetical protein HY080_08475 [Gammaproteobacteria bacterium]|nr:hypothetical protein [Gammaproteobacteria bacterium]